MNADTGAIWRFYGYRLTVSNGFYLPLSIVYLEKIRGFSLGDIGLIMGAFSIAMVLAEIPTGFVGDRLGRRPSLLIGNVIIATFMAGYTVVETPLAYLALHVFWAFGWAFRSGTADAWLYELLAGDDDTSDFARVRGRATTIELGFEAITAAVAGTLAAISWSLPFLANAAVATLGIPLLVTAPATSDDPDAAEDPITVNEALRILRLQIGHPRLRWFVLYVMLFSVLFQVTRVFEQPALLAVGISTTGLGVLYAGLKIVAAGAASTSGWLQDQFGARAVFALLTPLWAIAFLGVGLFPFVIVPVLFLNRSVKAVIRPIRNQYLNDRLDDVGRATVLSGVSMVLMSAGGVAKFVAGELAEAGGLLHLLAFGGVAVACVGGVVWLATSPFRVKPDHRATDPGKSTSTK